MAMAQKLRKRTFFNWWRRSMNVSPPRVKMSAAGRRTEGKRADLEKEN
jgi:hypothetical protein